MKFCNNCGKELIEGTSFCPECGAPVVNEATTDASADDFAIRQEKDCLDNFHRFLRYERTAWRVGAIVMLVVKILFIFLGSLIASIGAIDMGYDTPADEFMFATMGVMYILCGLLYLPIVIINFVMVSKTKSYMSTLYNDVSPTVSRCGSVGMIVLGAFFNTIAMIFIIINFVRVKNNKYILDRAAKRQQEFKQNNQ